MRIQLKREPHRQLDDTWRPSGNYLAKLAVDLLAIFVKPGRGIHISKLRVVEGIVHLYTKLQFPRFAPKGELFHKGQVKIVLTGRPKHVRRGIAEGALRRPGKSLRVKPSIKVALPMGKSGASQYDGPASISSARDIRAIRGVKTDIPWQSVR
jgi:hypothetical protein